jgi:hypothetical protein
LRLHGRHRLRVAAGATCQDNADGHRWYCSHNRSPSQAPVAFIWTAHGVHQVRGDRRRRAAELAGAAPKSAGLSPSRARLKCRKRASPDVLMIVRADRYDWRSIDTAPLDEDVTLLVREGRGRRSTSVPVPADRGRLDRFEQWNAADRHADKVEAVHSQPL